MFSTMSVNLLLGVLSVLVLLFVWFLHRKLLLYRQTIRFLPSESISVFGISGVVSILYLTIVGQQELLFYLLLVLLCSGMIVSFVFVRRLNNSYHSLVEEKSEFSNYLKASDSFFLAISSTGIILKWDSAAEKLTGYEEKEAVGQSCFDLLLPQSQVKHLKSTLWICDHQVVANDLFRFETKSGKELTVEVHAFRNTGGYGLTCTLLGGHLVEKAKYEKLLQSSSDAIVIIDAADNILKANKQAMLLYGYTKDELINCKSTQLIPERLHGLHNEHLKKIFEESAPLTFPSGSELYGVTKDGREFPVEISVHPTLSGPSSSALVYIRDISKQEAAEEELMRKNQLLNFAEKIVVMGHWQWDLTTNEVNWSDNLFDIFGQPRNSSLTYETYFAYVHPKDAEYVTSCVQKSIAEKKFHHFFHRIVSSDGTTKMIHLMGHVYVNDKGEVVEMVGTCQDVTEQKLAEKQMNDDISLLQTFITETPSAMAVFDTKMCFIAHSDKWLADFQIKETSLAGVSFYDVFPEWSERWRPIHYECLNGKVHKNDKEVITKKDGSQQWLIWEARPWYVAKDKVGGIAMHVTDISKLKQAEDHLWRKNEELSAIFNSSSKVSIISCNTYGTIRHFSQGASVLLGYDPEEVIGRENISFLHDPVQMAKRSIELSERMGREFQGIDVLVENSKHSSAGWKEWSYIHRNGQTFPVQLMVSAIKNSAGEVTGYLFIASDLSERKKMEQVRSNILALELKNKELEQFNFIASHDLQEPLRTVSNYIQVLEEDYGEELTADAKKHLKTIEKATGRMRDLVRSLLNYSRLGRGAKLMKTDTQDLVHSVLEDLQIAISEDDVNIEVGALPEIDAYEVELRQVFQNLIHNAIKFKQPDTALEISISAQQEEGQVRFAVEDNGIGIREKDFDRIFYIFQKLHPQQKYSGDGIGLSSCKKIIEMHGGKLWVTSTEGVGSSFYFTIPSEQHLT